MCPNIVSILSFLFFLFRPKWRNCKDEMPVSGGFRIKRQGLVFGMFGFWSRFGIEGGKPEGIHLGFRV